MWQHATSSTARAHAQDESLGDRTPFKTLIRIHLSGVAATLVGRTYSAEPRRSLRAGEDGDQSVCTSYYSLRDVGRGGCTT
jgi:hypothetical protein